MEIEKECNCAKFASEEDCQRIKTAIDKGNVTFADDAGLFSQPDGPVVIREIKAWSPWLKEKDGKTIGNKGGFKIAWSKPGIGFGELAFVTKNDDALECDSEGMSLKFIKEVLMALADFAIIKK